MRKKGNKGNDKQEIKKGKRQKPYKGVKMKSKDKVTKIKIVKQD